MHSTLAQRGLFYTVGQSTWGSQHAVGSQCWGVCVARIAPTDNGAAVYQTVLAKVACRIDAISLSLSLFYSRLCKPWFSFVRKKPIDLHVSHKSTLDNEGATTSGPSAPAHSTTSTTCTLETRTRLVLWCCWKKGSKCMNFADMDDPFAPRQDKLLQRFTCKKSLPFTGATIRAAC
mmetsp:Transcript_47762/g.71083  ORF Transcript_47762/g.71083 Transcript_47762/m.71083 type:complete len:176 (-) Transcript_47762:340-867(-)